LLIGAQDYESSLGLQMVHDQLAAAGYRTTLQADSSREATVAAIADDPPALVVLMGGSPAEPQALDALIAQLRGRHPDIAILLYTPEPAGVSPVPAGLSVLDGPEQSVAVVEELLTREHASS
ncbi:MAG: SGNH/GDSL hydrolase family protein, partial [Solirubrobacteraceae bacterium]